MYAYPNPLQPFESYFITTLNFSLELVPGHLHRTITLASHKRGGSADAVEESIRRFFFRFPSRGW